MSVLRYFSKTQHRPGQAAAPARPMDLWLLGAAFALLALGVVMVASSSITSAERATGQPFYFLLRQSAFIGVGLVCAWVVWHIRLVYWEKFGAPLLVMGLVLLLLVIVPGIGRAVNGSTRWLALGPVNLQPSEFVKLLVVIYLSGYLVRRGAEVQNSLRGFLKPMGIFVLMAALLLAEPDFGAALVMLATALGLLFLAGARLWHTALLIMFAVIAFAALAFAAPYRLQRLTTFLNPWADPFNSGFQLTQALIAFGRGDWFGVGLGASVQKLFYLPEAHTDFLFAVLAEELGLVGALIVIALFGVIVWRAFALAQQAMRNGNPFAAYLAYGIGLLIALAAGINLGVNMGLLPTKGLTLPFMSYGGSSVVASCIAVALLARIHYEVYVPQRKPSGIHSVERPSWRRAF